MADEYVWDWFDRRNAESFVSEGLAIPAAGAYGVRRGREVICLTSRFKHGYILAVGIAAQLNGTHNDATSEPQDSAQIGRSEADHGTGLGVSD